MLSSFRALPNLTRLAAPRYFGSTPSAERGIKKTVLDNGTTVISTPKNNDVLGSVGIYVKNTGGGNETHQSHGCGHYLARNLYKRTNRVTDLQITRILEAITASHSVSATLEHVVFKASFVKEHMDQVIMTLGDLLRPALLEYQFRDVRELVKHDMRLHSTDQYATTKDALNHVAFGGVGLGRSAICPAYNVNNIYPEDVVEYILDRVVASNFVVVGSVPDHDRFVNSVDIAIGNLPKEGLKPVPVLNSEYIGGTKLEPAASSVYAEVYKGALSGTKEAAAQNILVEILGCSDSRAQLPGNHNSTRLAKAFNGKGVEAKSFVMNESQPLIGVYATSPTQLSELSSLVHEQLTKLSEEISQEEFDSAVAALRSKASIANETRFGLIESVYLSADGLGAPKTDVNAKDVQDFAKKMLSGKSTIVAKGDLQNLPSFVR